jgi:hypothetical protein
VTKIEIEDAAVAQLEAAAEQIVRFEVDLITALAMVANLQLAARHPLNTGPSARRAREVVDTVKQALRAGGLESVLAMVELGDDPHYDIPGAVS